MFKTFSIKFMKMMVMIMNPITKLTFPSQIIMISQKEIEQAGTNRVLDADEEESWLCEPFTSESKCLINFDTDNSKPFDFFQAFYF